MRLCGCHRVCDATISPFSVSVRSLLSPFVSSLPPPPLLLCSRAVQEREPVGYAQHRARQVRPSYWLASLYWTGGVLVHTCVYIIYMYTQVDATCVLHVLYNVHVHLYTCSSCSCLVCVCACVSSVCCRLIRLREECGNLHAVNASLEETLSTLREQHHCCLQEEQQIKEEVCVVNCSNHDIVYTY